MSGRICFGNEGCKDMLMCFDTLFTTTAAAAAVFYGSLRKSIARKLTETITMRLLNIVGRHKECIKREYTLFNVLFNKNIYIYVCMYSYTG